MNESIVSPAGKAALANGLPESYKSLLVFLALAERMLLPVKNGLSSEHAALTEPMAVGWHAVQHARLTAGRGLQ